MIEYIKYWLRKKTFSDIGVVLVENVLSKGFHFLLIILISRTLGPEKYGVYSFVTVSVLFLALFFDFGMENVAVRFVGKHPDKQKEIFGIYFLFKTIMLVILFFLILLFPSLVVALVNKPEIEKYLSIIFIGCVVENYQYVIAAYFSSREKFLFRAFVNTGVYFLRLVSVFILLRLSVFDLRVISFIFVVSGIPFVLLFSRHFFTFLRAFFTNKVSRILFRSILHYAKWITVGSVAWTIMTRLDFYIVTSYLSFREVGLYNAAVQLLVLFGIVQIACQKVFLPKVAKYKDLSQMKNYIRKSVKLLMGISICIFLVMPFTRFMILFSFGREYLEISVVLRILLISFLFTLWNIMLGHVFYSLGYAKYMTIGVYIELVVFIISALSFIPRFGMEGAALSRMIGKGCYLLFVVYFLHRLVYLRKPLSNLEQA
ncbi:MAG: flippase [Candidatus Omnitrophica bacterium]|nr:flippase [Candidatus Omnitrophota bacterium]